MMREYVQPTPFNKELTVDIVDGALSVTIGLGVLAHAIKYMPGWDASYIPDPADNFAEFGKAMVSALEDEEEDGTTLLHLAFDKAAINAMEQGCEGFIEVND